MKPKHPPAPAMTLGNMRELGVRGLSIKCLNPKCLHEATVSVDDYADDMLVRGFAKRMVCAKCGSRGSKINVRPNRKEQPPQSSLT
jgi:hypothetical protein